MRDLLAADRFLRRIVFGAGVALCLLGAVVALGRLAGIPVLMTILPDAPPIAPTTALAFALCGLAFVGHARGWSRVAHGAALGVLALGLGTVVLYATADVFNWATFRAVAAKDVMGRRAFPDRMAPNAAISFTLLGTALVMLAHGTHRSRRLTLLAAVVLMFGGMAIVGYVTNLRATFSWWRYAGMALHTAMAFVLAGGVILFWGLRCAPARERAQARTFPFFALAAALSVVLGIIVIVSNDERTGALQAARHGIEIKAGVERFIGAMARADASVRNFALSGDERFLERVAVHRRAVFAAIEELERATADLPEQARRAQALRPAAGQNFTQKDREIAARQSGGVDAAAAVFRAEPAGIMQDLRAATDAIVEEADRFLAESERSTQIYEVKLRWALGVGGAAALGMMATAFFLLARAQRAAADANDGLEARVAERTRALTAVTEEMRAAEARFRSAIVDSPFAAMLWADNGAILLVNRRWVELSGYAATELSTLADWTQRALGRPPPADLPRFVAERFAETSHVHDGERSVRTKAGERRVWDFHTACIGRLPGGARLLVSKALDVTENRAAAAQLQESEQRYRRLAEQLEQRVAERTAEVAASEERMRMFAEHAPAPVAMFDREMRYLVVSREWFTTYGLGGDIIGRSHYDVFPEISETWRAVHRRCLAGAVEMAEADLFERADGTRQWLRWEVRPWHDARGEIGGIVMFTADITVRKTLEENLARARDNAIETSRLKSQFLASVSHEIRTPMNAIIGMTGVLAETRLTPDQLGMLRVVQGGAESLLALVNDILDLTRIEAGKLRLHTEEFDLREVIDETIALLTPRALAKQLALGARVDLPPRVRLLGDAGRIRQVLTNLIDNAIKFTARGEVIVTATLTRDSASEAGVRLAVRDTGRGIAPEMQAKLFQPFVQLGEADSLGGTGLGLAVSRQLLELMGGKIGCESAAGQGSTFWLDVTLPRAHGPAIAPQRPALVLAVEDDEDDAELLQRELGRADIPSTSVRSGAEALAWLRERQASGQALPIVLIDWHLRGMSGLQIAAAIKADPAIAAARLVAMSGGPLADPSAAQAAGFETFLRKPVRATAVQRCLTVAGSGALSAEPVRRPAPGAGRGLRILLAEDNPANQVVARMLLAKIGAEIDVAANGELALERLAQARYDAVLMDCQMPALNGYDATRRIRGGTLRGVDPQVPIIAVTAYAMSEDRAKCLVAGMNDYVTKPLRLPELCAALERSGFGHYLRHEAIAEAPPVRGVDAVLDARTVETLRAIPGENGPSLLPEIAARYLAGEATELRRIEALLHGRAREQLAELVHAMAGNAAAVGGFRTREAALALESVVRAGDRAKWPAAFAALHEECGRLRAALRELQISPIR